MTFVVVSAHIAHTPTRFQLTVILSNYVDPSLLGMPYDKIDF